MIQAGPEWVGDNQSGHFEIGGREVEWTDGVQLGPEELVERLVGRKIVAARQDGNISFLRLDDGSHIAFQGMSLQSEDALFVLLWEDVPVDASSDPPKASS